MGKLRFWALVTPDCLVQTEAKMQLAESKGVDVLLTSGEAMSIVSCPHRILQCCAEYF